MLKEKSRLQEDFSRRESEYRHEIDRLRNDHLKMEEELRAQRESSRRLEIEFEDTRNNGHNASMNSSTARGYE